MRPIQLHGHERPLTRVIYNREGDLIFSAARDKSPNVWYAHTGERLGSYDGHNGAIFDIDVDYNSQRLITGSGDNTARLWDVETGKTLFEWEFPTLVRSAQFAMGDRQALIMTDSRKGQNGFLNIFPIYPYTGQETTEAPSSTSPIQSIVMPNTNKALIARWGALNKVIYTGHEDGSLIMWNINTGTQVKSSKPHSEPITDLQLSRDKTYLITSSKDCTAKIIDAETLQEIKVYQSDRPLNSAATSPLADQIIVGGGQEARDVTTTSSKAGKFEVCFYHRIFQSEIGRMKAHFSPINTLAFHPSGKSFVSGAEEGYVRIYHFDQDYFNYSYE